MTQTLTAIADRVNGLADAFEAKVASVRQGDWGKPSPCARWTARDVVRHVVDVHEMMLRPVRAGLGHGPSVDEDPLAAFRSARAAVQLVLDDPDLAGTEYDGMFGRAIVSDTIDQFLCFDLVVHGWDLARATGQDETIPDVEVGRILGFIERMGVETMREHGVVGPAVPVPPDAAGQQRMLGLLGRDAC